MKYCIRIKLLLFALLLCFGNLLVEEQILIFIIFVDTGAQVHTPPAWVVNFYEKSKNGIERVQGMHGLGWYLDFKSRFIAKDTETQLYEREFYDELYQLIKSNGSHFYLILGNPGIGKSCFGMYLVYRFIQEHKEIIYHSDTGLVYWFRRDVVQAYYQNVAGEQLNITVAITDNPDIIYITDGNIQPEAVSLPLDGKGGSVIAVASTQCIQKNLHEYKKQALSHTYYVPRYGLEELEELFCVHSNPYGYKL